MNNDIIGVVARPEGVYQSFMGKPLDSLTAPETERESAAIPVVRANPVTLSPEAIAHIERRVRMPIVWFPERSADYVYFIGADRGAVKIGISCNPLMRMRQLQISTADKLRLLAFAPGSYDHEKLLHGFYQRERLTGEWFRRSKRLREFIDAVNAGEFTEGTSQW